jgi:hypothetical protein
VNRVAIDNVPTLARPPEVERAISEARGLRDVAQQSADEVAAVQAKLDQLEQQDVEGAAARARAGEPLGTPGAPVRKAKDALALGQRNLAAVRLAVEQAEADTVDAISARADVWDVALQAEREQAREQAQVALAALEDAVARIGGAGAAQNWLAAASDDGRYDRPVKPTLAFALSSARRTANNEPLSVAELVGFLREAIDPAATDEPLAVLKADVG